MKPLYLIPTTLSYLVLFLLYLIIYVLASRPAFAATDLTTARQAIVVDYNTGAILFEKNADARMTPSSMSKEMTMYLVFEALKNGRLKLDETLPVSERAWRMQGSKMFAPLGTEVKVEDLIRGVTVDSGNDAAVALAEGLGGSEDAFVGEMNAKAKLLGMTGSHFANASGWPNPEHYSTARDLSILALRMIRDFPDYYHFYAIKEFTYNNIKQGNRNPLLYRNINADGIKTGHTEDGGYGLMGSGARDGRRVVFVVNGLDSMQARADEGVKLLNWGLKTYEDIHLFKAGEPVEQAKVAIGKEKTVPLALEKDLIVTVPVVARNSLKVKISYTEPLEAPVRKGQRVGTLHVVAPDLAVTDVPLVAGQDVGRLGLFQGAIAKAKLLLANL